MKPIPFRKEVKKMPEEAIVRQMVMVHEYPRTTWHEESAFYVWEDRQMP